MARAAHAISQGQHEDSPDRERKEAIVEKPKTEKDIEKERKRVEKQKNSTRSSVQKLSTRHLAPPVRERMRRRHSESWATARPYLNSKSRQFLARRRVCESLVLTDK